MWGWSRRGRKIAPHLRYIGRRRRDSRRSGSRSRRISDSPSTECWRGYARGSHLRATRPALHDARLSSHPRATLEGGQPSSPDRKAHRPVQVSSRTWCYVRQRTCGALWAASGKVGSEMTTHVSNLSHLCKQLFASCPTIHDTQGCPGAGPGVPLLHRPPCTTRDYQITFTHALGGRPSES